MVELLVWRHAKTERRSAGTSDHERRLRPIGRTDAEEIGRLLVSHDLVPQVVLCSDALRAKETADIASALLEPPPTRFDLPELYDGDSSEFLKVVSIYGGEATRLLLVGHNPDIESFVSSVAGRDIEMKTAALAVIDADAPRAADVGRGTLLRLRTMLLPSRRAE
jgi:phosphohistidine phosphatase